MTQAQTADTTNGATLIGKHGLTGDPRGAHAIFTLSGRDYIVEIIKAYRDEVRCCWLVDTRHFCGDKGPTVALGFVKLLNRY